MHRYTELKLELRNHREMSKDKSKTNTSTSSLKTTNKTGSAAQHATKDQKTSSQKFASTSSRDVERKVENKHLNLKSETHAQNKQRGAARDERSEDLESEVRPTTPTKNRLHPKGNPKSSRTTSDTIVYHISTTVAWHNLHTEHPWRVGGGVARRAF